MSKNKLNKLQSVVRKLRSPDGCSWDKKQTFSSLAPHTIEEAYEVENAIVQNDMENLKEELGDLILQIVFHSQIAEEQEIFQLSDVIEGVITKMKRRHPHVFIDDNIKNGSSADNSPLPFLDWDSIKTAEKANKQNNLSNDEKLNNPNPTPWELMLLDIPIALPALSRSVKIQTIEDKAGFKNTSHKQLEQIKNLLDKLNPPDAITTMSNNEIASTDKYSTTSLKQLSGEFLFLCVDYFRRLGINSEMALRETNISHEENIKKILPLGSDD